MSNQIVKKIAWSTLTQYAGKIAQLGLGIVAVKLIAGFFSTFQYSEYLRIMEYCLFFSVVANLGIFANVIRRMTDKPDCGRTFANALILRVVSAFLIFGVGAAVVPLFVGDRLFLAASLVFLTSLLFDYVTSVCGAMLQANYLMGRATFALLVGRIVNLAVIAWLVVDFSSTAQRVAGGAGGGGFFPGDGIFAYWRNLELVQSGTGSIFLLFLAPLIASLVTMGLSFYFARKKLKLEWKIDRELCRDLILTGLPFGIVNIINNLYFRFLPQYLANDTLPPEQFATFDISYRIAFVLSLFSTFLMFSVMPAFRKSVSGKDWIWARKLFKRSFQLLVVTGTVLVIMVSFLAPLMIETFTHKKYFLPQFWFILPMFMLLAAVSYLYDLILITLFSSEKQWWLLKREIVAFSAAGVVFATSFLVGPIEWKIAVIILGAIVGEAAMVSMGMREIKRVLAGE